MEIKLRLTRRRVVVLVVLAAVIGAGVAYAAIPDGSKVFTACMLKNVGTIRLIDPSLPTSSPMSHCNSSLETQVSWNQLGQAGAAGKDGTDGLNGTNGAPGTPGQDGADGVSVTSATEPAGTNCATGGSKFTAAANNVTFACNGAKGDTGATGPQGPAGSGNRVFSGSVNAAGEPQQTGFTVTHSPGSVEYVVHLPAGTFSGSAGKFAIPVVTGFGPQFASADGVFVAIPLGPIAADGSASFDVQFASANHFFNFIVAVSIS
jgi:hypothetical protein